MYIAQRLRASGHLYHRTCFRCARCSAQLSLVDSYETQDGSFCCETCPDEMALSPAFPATSLVKARRKLFEQPTPPISDLTDDLKVSIAKKRLIKPVVPRDSDSDVLSEIGSLGDKLGSSDFCKASEFEKKGIGIGIQDSDKLTFIDEDLYYSKDLVIREAIDQGRDVELKANKRNEAIVDESPTFIRKLDSQTDLLNEEVVSSNRLGAVRAEIIDQLPKESDFISSAKMTSEENTDSFVEKETEYREMDVKASRTDNDLPLTVEKSVNSEVRSVGTDNETNIGPVEANIKIRRKDLSGLGISGICDDKVSNGSPQDIATNIDIKDGVGKPFEIGQSRFDSSLMQGPSEECVRLESELDDFEGVVLSDNNCEGLVASTEYNESNRVGESTGDVVQCFNVPVIVAVERSSDHADYPVELNPFGDEDEDNNPNSNPFGEREEKGEVTSKVALKVMNPFWSDGEEPSSDEDTQSPAVPVPLPRKIKSPGESPEPSPRPRSKVRTSLSPRTRRRKPPAPRPPTASTTLPRKSRHAPQPPMTGAKSVTPAVGTVHPTPPKDDTVHRLPQRQPDTTGGPSTAFAVSSSNSKNSLKTEFPQLPLTEPTELPSTEPPQMPSNEPPDLPHTEPPQLLPSEYPQCPTTEPPQMPSNEPPLLPYPEPLQLLTTEHPQSPPTNPPQMPPNEPPQLLSTEHPQFPSTKLPQLHPELLQFSSNQTLPSKPPQLLPTEHPQSPPTKPPQMPFNLFSTEQSSSTQHPQLSSELLQSPSTQSPSSKPPQLPNTEPPQLPSMEHPQSPLTNSPQMSSNECSHLLSTEHSQSPTTNPLQLPSIDLPSDSPTTKHRQPPSEESTPPAGLNKSTFGQWKRKKGPAPSRPIPVRRSVRPMPMKEIRQELDDIEIKQQGMERQGVKLEEMIRNRCQQDSSMTPYVEEMVLQLFELVNEKNELFRRQAELMYLRRQHNLEEEHAELEYEIRCLMLRPERNKTDSDKAREEQLIQRLVDVVEKRNEIVECLELDRVREKEEDRSVNAQLGVFSAAMVADGDVKAPKKRKKEKKGKKDKTSQKGVIAFTDEVVDESEREVTKSNKKKWYTLQHAKRKSPHES